MAPSRKLTRAARFAAIMQTVQADLAQSVALLQDTEKALSVWAAELSPDVEGLRQAAIGLQSEGIRTAIHAQGIRAAAERLSIVSQFMADEGGPS